MPALSVALMSRWATQRKRCRSHWFCSIRASLLPECNGRNIYVDVKQILLDQYSELVSALRFLSVLPVPGSAQLFDKDETAPRLVIGCEYFPIVGLLLALVLCLPVLLFSRLLPHLALSALD